MKRRTVLGFAAGLAAQSGLTARAVESPRLRIGLTV